MIDRTQEERDLYWKQLERASSDTKSWPSYVKEAFPTPEVTKIGEVTSTDASTREKLES
jgi:hypothetical protein